MHIRSVCIFGAAILAAGAWVVPGHGADLTAAESEEIQALKTELEALKGQLPSQSHTMIDVEYHFTNLWFAGQGANWPLAAFYLNETVNHIAWALRVRPIRPTSKGPLDIRPIFESAKAAEFANLKSAIEQQDAAAFETAYRAALEQCHGCHVAAEKPYLRTQIPTAPATHIISMQPARTP